jgi:hypothetical protein
VDPNEAPFTIRQAPQTGEEMLRVLILCGFILVSP